MPAPVKTLLVTAALVLCLAGSAKAPCPAGDLTGDCKVDWEDVKAFAEQWLDSGDCEDVVCADFDGLNGVNLVDFAFLANYWLRHGPTLVINEFMASNNRDSNIHDPCGDYDDWIEIYNYGDTPIDLAWMYLTDDLGSPTKWQIPSGYPAQTTAPADGFVVFWADEEPAEGPLHADFKLSVSGEEIGLFDTDGITPIDTIVFGEQTTNISYGRYPDASDNWRFFPIPTAGASNNGAYMGVIEDVEFSHTRGFYSTSFNLTMACVTPGVSIYYTTNGKAPIVGEAAAAGSTLYTVPVAVSSTKCVRAAAIKTGWMPSKINTQTYLFLADVITQSPTGSAPTGWPTGPINGQVIDYGMDPDVVNNGLYVGLVDDALLAIPTISLVTDTANLFDPAMGIYVNAVEHGDEATGWERPVSVELINPDGSEGFQIDAGLRIRGGYSRNTNNPKHAFRLFFRSEYGKEKLNYPLFGDEGVDEFEKIDLSTAQNYSWSFYGDYHNTMLREVFSRDTQGQMGQPYTRSRYYHLYIDGQYWGIYQTQERPEARYAASYFGGNAEDYDTVKPIGYPEPGNYTIEATDGNLVAYDNLWDAATAGFATNSAYYQVQGLNTNGTRNPAYKVQLDVNNLIDYMLNTFYTGDFDAPITMWESAINNFFAIYNRNGQDGWKFFKHDAEHSLFAHVPGFDPRGWGNNPSIDRTGPWGFFSDFPRFNPQWLHERLALNAEYRMRFADRTYKHFFNEGPMVASTAVNTLTARKNQIDSAIIAESARWGDAKVHPPRTRNSDWLPEINTLISDFFPTRVGVVIGQLRNDGWYPNIDPPAFNQHGGHVSGGFSLTMTNPNGSGTIYYTTDGNDPRTSINLMAGSAAKRVLVPTAAISDNWRGSGAFDDSGWTYVTGSPGGIGYDKATGSGGNYIPYISYNVESLMYNKNATCYIRIPFTVNAGDISKFISMTLNMRYDDGFVAYINGTEVYRKYFTGAPLWNSHASTDRTTDCSPPESFDISGYLGALLPGNNILAIHGLNYSTTNNDFLTTAELVATKSIPSAIKYITPITLATSADVKSRVVSGTTWSALNEAVFEVGNIANKLRITEIMFHPANTNDPNDPNEEFIELKNIGAQTLNLNLVRFTKGISFTFPDVNLAAGQYIVVVKDVNAFTAEYDGGVNITGQYTGSLDNAGERIRLEDALGQVILDFEYKDGWRSITDGDGYSLTLINPANPDANSWGYNDSWRASAYVNGSPGWDDSGIIPNPGAIAVNEVMAHSHAGAPDWIELYNTTASAINIGGWYLSDSDANLLKYRFATGTTIPAYGYIVVYEDVNFGSSASDPGRIIPFALSENGEMVCLASALDGNSMLTGYREKEDFGASETGVSFGRYYKASTNSYNFVPMANSTQDYTNAYPKVGPIVITEIMYHPNWPASGSYTNDQYEYIELRNISGSPVTLYDSNENAPWKFTDGIDYTFGSPPDTVTIPAGGRILVVKNPTAFNWRYPGLSAITYGPYDGKLDNAGERVQIGKPGDEDAGIRYYIRVDRVDYSDGSHPGGEPGNVDLWPTAADGQGKSLTRKYPNLYGNDPNNWQAATPTPGS
jgi:hypothetical protein